MTCSRRRAATDVLVLASVVVLLGVVRATVADAREAPSRQPEGRRPLRPSDLRVLDSPATEMLKDYLTRLVDAQFARRDRLLSKLRTAADWQQRARFILRKMAEWTGPFPPRTPLNARVVGRVERPDFTLEKVLFESRPGFVVSANLYLPKGFEGPRPAVLNVIGHSAAGKATEKVQRRSISQARKGLVALTMDGLGQGERQVPEYAAAGRPPGNAHRVLGLKAFLAGTHVFNLMAWDVVRAVDYLVSRPEVDASKIACTGCSGGGMMTTYILPLEPRIAVAVPACNPNTWSRRVHAGLATDHEQVFPGAFAFGVDPRGDPLFCHVPKPLLIDATTDDTLNPPRGVWELATWLERAYAAYGHPERFKVVLVRGPHGYNREQRELAYAWMLRWLTGDSADYLEDDFDVLDEKATWCTRSGNVFRDGLSWSPQRWVQDFLKAHRPTWPPVTDAATLSEHKRRWREQARRLLGLPRRVDVPRVEERPSRTVGTYRLTPLVLEPEPGIRLPAVWVEAAATQQPPRGEGLQAGEGPARRATSQRGTSSHRGPVVLYLSDQGKASLVNEPLLERLVLERGGRVLAVDLRGWGETAPGLHEKFWDILAGRPLLAQRVADVLSVLRWLSERTDSGPDTAEQAAGGSKAQTGRQCSERATAAGRTVWETSTGSAAARAGVRIWAKGVAALCAALAAPFDGTVEALVLQRPLLSFDSVVTVTVPKYDNQILLPGVLQRFDLPQVYQACCPSTVVLVGPLRADGRPASRDELDAVFASVVATYRSVDAADRWRVLPDGSDEKRASEMLSALAGR